MKKLWRTLPLALLCAGGLTALAGLGVLKAVDLLVSDTLYQEPQATDGKIILVGIDQRALEELGPYSQWDREIFARAVEVLNAREDCRPAAIGLDVLFTGDSTPEADLRLAQAAGQYGNVAAACAGEFGSAMAADGRGDYYLKQFSLLSFSGPYAVLDEAAARGHINAMLDSDGVLRHHMLTLDTPDGEEVPSLALALARMYWERHDIQPPALPETSRLGFWYLPFFGRPGDMSQSISIAGLLAGEIRPDFFAGKIVLIGPYAAGLQDSYITSIDHARPMYGVEFQANAVQALLQGEHRSEAGDGVQLLALFLVLLAVFWVFSRKRLRMSTALWAGLCVGWLLLCRLAYARGLVLHALWVPAGATVLYVGCIAANYLRVARERRRIIRTFEHCTDPKIVRELLKLDPNSLHLEGKTVPIAVLFVDVRGYTAMSTQKTPEEVAAILNEYLKLVSKCVMRYEGTLDKFIGDAAMAFWNAPLEQEDYVMRAAMAALDMVRGASELEHPVHFGVGVHTGEALVGSIGFSERIDYTAIGDTVNTTSRLESNAKDGEIYISRDVVEALKGRIRYRKLEHPPQLKGKEPGYEIFSLEGLEEEPETP